MASGHELRRVSWLGFVAITYHNSQPG